MPPVPNNSTILICLSFGTPFANLSLSVPGGGNTALDFFAASNVTAFMSGGFWTLKNANMLETVTRTDGTRSHHWVFPSDVTGAMAHSVTLNVRERVRYTVGHAPVNEEAHGDGVNEALQLSLPTRPPALSAAAAAGRSAFLPPQSVAWLQELLREPALLAELRRVAQHNTTDWQADWQNLTARTARPRI